MLHHVVFKLVELAVVVDTSIKHDRVRRNPGVPPSEGDDRDVRGSDAARGWHSRVAGSGLGVDLLGLGLLANLGRVVGVIVSMGVLLECMGVLLVGMGVLLVSMGVLLESLGVLLSGLHGSVTWGASACKLTFARA
jgi:hypothetical protein